jgi:hypothetical protein
METDVYKIGRNTKKMGKRYKEDLKIMKINHWAKCIHNWVKLKEVAEKAKTCK